MRNLSIAIKKGRPLIYSEGRPFWGYTQPEPCLTGASAD